MSYVYFLKVHQTMYFQLHRAIQLPDSNWHFI